METAKRQKIGRLDDFKEYREKTGRKFFPFFIDYKVLLNYFCIKVGAFFGVKPFFTL